MHNPFRYFNSSPEVIRLAVMMYVRYPLSLRQVEDLLCERGIDICHETVRYWWNRFGPLCPNCQHAGGGDPLSSWKYRFWANGRGVEGLPVVKRDPDQRRPKPWWKWLVAPASRLPS